MNLNYKLPIAVQNYDSLGCEMIYGNVNRIQKIMKDVSSLIQS